ncbi:NACHT, LRR and PYD domains-containing protein 12-like isoform X3 [Salminus brasiliensis]|uniref:NACHT, LRR and PYD domains-containing protein 12-like isoform X3 n=1 Tax=Salminus brasiliensis TaxID=930266 RepID=UPI003B838BFB
MEKEILEETEHDPSTGSTAVQPGCVQSSIWAKSGGTVNAPSLISSHFSAPVIFNFNTSAEDLEKQPSVVCDESRKQVLREKLMLCTRQLCTTVYEGTSDGGSSIALADIYTELYIVEGHTGGVSNQHEVWQIEALSRAIAADTPVEFSDIFKECSDSLKQRTVLTLGIAGVGKTVSIQKFALEWAEGKTNEDIDFVFLMSFRDLNPIMEEHYSLYTLLCYFYHQLDLKTEDVEALGGLNVLFVFDGLDESRLALNFTSNKMVCDVTEMSSVDLLIVNLIIGNMLPSARIWITSRPAAAHQVPSKHIDLVTEVRGFNDDQKEEYFRKRVSNQEQASKIISHIKKSKSLYIMCHIPVFCWISATVLQLMLDDEKYGEDDQQQEEVPTTLTGMYTNFMLYQIDLKLQKYPGRYQKKSQEYVDYSEEILRLAELAYKNLLREKFIFFEKDLQECGINVQAASKAPVDSLVTNLINGNLLPTARLWITSRPAAANQIPLEYVDLFTEIRGFTDKQKEEYFRKRIPDETEASRIITHIKISQSLYIMCHIPVFCWITATVLQEILIKKQEDVPSTLTEMYIHFLLIQMNMKNQKYDKEVERDLTKLVNSNRVMILKLAKLAFEQLKKENIMFYENDLRDCGIDASEDSEYSGMCAEIFKQESVLYEKKVYCFIHLSLQEFLAAFYVFYTYLNKDMEDLQFFFGDQFPKKFLLEHLLTKAFDKAMESEKGHLDLFLRFLLGISHESNHKHLTCLLPQTENTKKSISKVIQHIKQLQNTSENLNLSPEKSINNFFCLLELKDSSLYNQIMKYMNVEALPDKSLSLSNCSALAYILVVSEELLDELNPKKYNTSNAACRRLVPAVRCCKKALFAGCELTMSCCECVSMALQSENSPLRELDLSDNYGLETATTLLSDGLKSSHCKLEILRLARCNFSQKSCAELVSALRSTAPNLKELDLSSNDLQDSGLNQLLFGLGNLNCKLQILRLGWCNLTEKSCKFLSSFLNTTSESCLTELDLSDNDLQNAGIELLSAGLENPKCRLEILRLSGCMITEEGCSSLASALSLNPSYLKELDLSYNHPGESGEKLLSARQEDPLCHFLLRIDPKGEQFIKAGMKKYACRLTLDPNTAHKKLYLSEANRRVTFTNEIQDYPDHPDRFETFPQVLCKEGLSARCYWEVKCEEKPEIGVTYPQIQRKEEGITVYDAQAQIGLNVVSWILGSSPIGYHACHASEYTNINTTVPESGRIGVFLDWPAGILSFYSISTDTQTVSHLHTFHTTFKNHLFPAFFVDFGSVSICQID